MDELEQILQIVDRIETTRKQVDMSERGLRELERDFRSRLKTPEGRKTLQAQVDVPLDALEGMVEAFEIRRMFYKIYKKELRKHRKT